jgi:predicted aldo/keto reductase-like oxidoreductase
MTAKKKGVSRRRFLKASGAVGLSAGMTTLSALDRAQASISENVTEPVVVPKRPFGASGVDVSMLSLGGVLKMSDQLIFRQAFKLGVTYWDTDNWYGWGKNEKAIGKYLAKFPEDREKLFIVTKAQTSDPDGLTEKLHGSLERLQTDYVDMYFISSVSNVDEELTDAVKRWAEKNKASGRIRLFGFASHKNMENCLLAASQLGWIDGIMMTYNYRLMVKDEMKRAVDACAEAGIGLTAMKTQAAFTANFYSAIGSETDEAVGLTENFLKKGYTAEQAKLKAVWQNPQIASICSAMSNMTVLQANVAAALNKKEISSSDLQRLQRYAVRTAPGYCTGCADICEAAVNPRIPISDILRYAMYHHSYGEKEVAARLFARLPSQTKFNLLTADYAEAEKRCPQKIQIERILKETFSELA